MKLNISLSRTLLHYLVCIDVEVYTLSNFVNLIKIEKLNS